MSGPPLLNPKPSDAAVCQHMLAALHQLTAEAEDRLRVSRARDHTEYTDWAATAAAYRKAFQSVETIFNKHYRV